MGLFCHSNHTQEKKIVPRSSEGLLRPGAPASIGLTEKSGVGSRETWVVGRGSLSRDAGPSCSVLQAPSSKLQGRRAKREARARGAAAAAAPCPMPHAPSPIPARRRRPHDTSPRAGRRLAVRSGSCTSPQEMQGVKTPPCPHAPCRCCPLSSIIATGHGR
jgi:hypothetical protein